MTSSFNDTDLSYFTLLYFINDFYIVKIFMIKVFHQYYSIF